ncbi:hypothetical protein ANCCAN_03559 [Ancylostoma caninum]|uniref:Tetratricopeptide repeat protein n=1 Tax=Ancylostoma caninum TaxID=29170 RepID=A0A368H4Z6_ANCCA|nr:hypothetical protein ANCCAN_03559 [Ancylostoma caninum]
MAELKAALKEAKKLLSEGRSEDALNVVQELLDDGVEDYMLFSFAALANANLDNVKQARILYDKAITLDKNLPVAWQGLYKLFDTSKLSADDRALEVCNHLLGLSDSKEKRHAIEESRRRFLFELGRYDQLERDLGTNMELLRKVINKLTKKDILSTTETALLGKAFHEVKESFGENADWNLHYCKFLYKRQEKEWRGEVKKFCSCHQYEDIAWIRGRLLEIIAEEFFCTLIISDAVFDLYSKCTSVMNELEKQTDQVLKSLSGDDMAGTLDIIDGLSGASFTYLPLAMVAAHLLAEIENWEKLVQVVDWMLTQNLTLACEDVACWLKKRALLEMNQPEDALGVKVSSDHPPSMFVIDSAKLSLLKGDDLDDFIQEYGVDSPDAKRIRIVRALYNRKADVSVMDAELLLNDDSLSWQDLVMVAELYIALGKDATLLLVRAAKINPRSSRVFFVLGKSLRRKNPAKARSCLERAVKIRPNNQEYVRELDDVYEESEESADQRMELLSRLDAYNKPMWLRKRLVKLAKLKKDWEVVIDELQQIIRYDQNDVASWADLAEAYSHRGNLQSSVNAYGKLLEIDTTSDYAICLIQVLMRMHNLEGAAEQCERWRSCGSQNSRLKNVVDLLDAQVHLRLFDKAVDEERFEHLKVVFKLAESVVSERPRISLAYKLAADSLLRVIKFRDDIMMDVGIPKSWSVSDRLSALRSAVMFYSVALELNRENGWAWSDLAVSLLHQARLENSPQHALKASDCLRKAMSLFECAQARSYVWTLIAEAERLSAIGEGANKDAASSAALQQHYLVRALQLNKANDEAWLRLALLYYSNGAMDLAHLAIEEALKHNPLLAEAWCAYAMKADSEGAYHEAIDMFRHSVSIKPIAAAVMKYTAMLCQTLHTKSFDPATVMIDFNKVLKLRDEKDCVAKDVLLHIGILAELFGHYEDAVNCISESGQNGLHLQRARMKAGEKIRNPEKPLEKLAKLCATPTEDLFNLLKEKIALYKNVFDRLVAPEAEGLQQLYNDYSKSISIPLVVAAVIRFGIPLCDQAVSVLHDVLPRHELIDVFPTIMPEEMDNGLKYVEQDGEEPFRYSHFIAKPLWEVLKKRRDELESETNGEVVEAV